LDLFIIYYRFNSIEIEVRNKKDPIIEAGRLSDYNYNFGIGWVSNNIYS